MYADSGVNKQREVYPVERSGLSVLLRRMVAACPEILEY
jgi:hypothetical protein